MPPDQLREKKKSGDFVPEVKNNNINQENLL